MLIMSAHSIGRPSVSVSGGGFAYTHRVDPVSGNDSNTYAQVTSDPDTYSWATPYRALRGAPAGSADNASEAIQAGDTLRIDDGIYIIPDTVSRDRFAPAWNPVNNGTSGNPITIRAETDGGVEIRFNDNNDTGAAFGAYNRSYITWRGIYVDEQYAHHQPDTGPCVAYGDGETTNTHHIIIEYCTLIGRIIPTTGENYNGIRVQNAENITLRYNYVSGFIIASRPTGQNSCCVMTYGATNLYIYNNYFNDTNGVWLKGNSYSDNCGIHIYRNHFNDCHQYGVRFTNTINTCDANTYSNRVYLNLITQTTYQAGAGFATLWDSEGIAFVNNTIVGTTWGCYWRNAKQTFVTITRDGTTANVYHPSHGKANGNYAHVEGCTQPEYNGDWVITVVDTDNYTFTVSGSPASPATGTPQVIDSGDGFNPFLSNTILVQNNIFANQTTGGITLGNNNDPVFTMFEWLQDRNCWFNIASEWWYNYGFYTSLSAWEAAYFAATGLHLEQNAITSDPQFVGSGDYTLQSTSPCKPANGGTGQDILQLLGGTTTDPIDMGCYAAGGTIGIPS